MGEPHTKSHDGQADGSTSEAVRKTHGNICLVYVSDGNEREIKSKLRIRRLGDSETRDVIIRM